MIKELINDLAYDRITINQGLTRAKLIANKIKDSDFSIWINNELNGYPSAENIPEYRKITCGLVGSISDFHGLRTIPIDASWLDKELGGKIYLLDVQQSIDTLEESIAKTEGDTGYFVLPMQFVQKLSEMAHTRLIDAGREVQKSQLRYIVNQTKQRLLDTLMQMDEMFPNFENSYVDSKENKEKVQNIINNHIYGTNISTNIGVGENVNQSIHSENISEKLAELKELGVDDTSLSELEDIVKQKDSKSTLTKITSWIGKMTTKAFEKGIEYQVPVIIDKVNDMLK